MHSYHESDLEVVKRCAWKTLWHVGWFIRIGRNFVVSFLSNCWLFEHLTPPPPWKMSCPSQSFDAGTTTTFQHWYYLATRDQEIVWCSWNSFIPVLTKSIGILEMFTISGVLFESVLQRNSTPLWNLLWKDSSISTKLQVYNLQQSLLPNCML